MGAVDGLLLALASTFTVILAGYVLRSRAILTAAHADGIGKLVSFIALPSLLFISMATVDFSTVNWFFLLGIVIAKSIVFILVFIFSNLLDRTTTPALSAAALRSMASTQSNDFALGLPVLNALFPPDVVQYLFLTAPIQLILLNPIGFIFLEAGRQAQNPSQSSSKLRNLGAVLLNVIRNPVVFMTLFGMIFNFMVSGKPPAYVSSVLNTLGNAFAAGALLNLGGSLYGKLSGLRGKSLLLPMLLVLAKSLLLPILILVCLSLLGVDKVTAKNGKTYDLTMLGFIIGTLPTAPSVYVFAILSGVCVSEMVQVVVLSTATSAPITLLASVLAEISLDKNSNSDWEALISDTAENLCIASLVLVCWVAFLHLYTRMKNSLGRLHVLVLALCLVILSATVQTCRVEASSPGDRTRFVVIRATLFAIRNTVAINTVSMAILFRFGSATCERMQRPLQTISTLLVLAQALANGFAVESPSPGGFNDDRCWIGSLMNPKEKSGIIVVLVESLYLLICLVVSLIILIRSGSFKEKAKAASSSDSAERSQQLAEKQNTLLVADRENGGSAPNAASSSSSASASANNAADDEDGNESAHSLSFRDMLFVLYTTMSVLFSFLVAVWLLSASNSAGIYIQAAFFEAFLVSTLGIMLFLIHGTKRRYTAPVDRLLQRIGAHFRRMAGRERIIVPAVPFESLEEDVQQSITVFKKNIQDFKAQHVHSRSIRGRAYPNVFLGSELVDFILGVHMASSREEGVTVGNHLFQGRILHHIFDEHPFEDGDFLYRFFEDEEESNMTL